MPLYPFRLAGKIERKNYLRNPKPRHFKVYKNTGLLRKVLGTVDGKWYVKHKSVDQFPRFGPFDTKNKAETEVAKIIKQLKVANEIMCEYNPDW